MTTQTKPSIDEMINIYNELKDEDEYFGMTLAVRSQEMPFTLGETIDHISHVLDRDEDTGEELDGICATDFAFPSDLKPHSNEATWDTYGDYTAILAGDCVATGTDPGEVILQNAIVAYVF